MAARQNDMGPACHSFETVTFIETAKNRESGRRSPNATARNLLRVASKDPSVLMV